MNQSQDRPLSNALDENQTNEQKVERSRQAEKKDSGQKNSESKADMFWRIFFRTGLATFFGFLVAGILAGFMEGAEVGYVLNFGSPLMLGLSIVTVAAFWVLFTFIGPYSNR